MFRDLYYLEPGDEVLLHSDGQVQRYMVTERLVVDEIGVSAAQRQANAQYIQPTGQEVVTLVTCWPLTGPDPFHQRVIVRAVPVGE